MKRDESVFAILHNILTEQKELLQKISTEIYTRKSPSLDSSTIGGHTRHILEFLEILLNSYHLGKINYDERQRNPELEKNPGKAVEIISGILSEINLPDKKLILHQTVGNISLEITTNFYRELLYNIEHCIHHQALIKVAFNEMKISHLVNINFGIAPSTVQYRETQNIN